MGSLLTAPPDRARSDAFYTKIHTPIGQEDQLELPLDEAVPEAQRIFTAGGLFTVKPTRQSWGGFLLFLGACAACALCMALLLAA